MSPQWIPQNIQKRLLRYVLQQLAIFSDLDLQDLDVSLGKICLQNVLLNPETFQFTDAFLRSGHVESLELNLTLTDGITINASQTEIIIVLANSKLHLDQQQTEDEKAFNLSHSTADFAKSMMLVGDEVSNSSDSEDNEESSTHRSKAANKSESAASIDNTPSSKDDSKKSPSFYSSYINKAVEMALAKLLLNISSVLIKVIISENHNISKNDSHFFIEIDNITYNSATSKEIKVSGFKIFTDIDQEEKFGNSSVEAEEDEQQNYSADKQSHSYQLDSDSDVLDEMIESSFLPNNVDMYKSSANFSMYQSAHSDLSESAILTLNHLNNEENAEEKMMSENLQEDEQLVLAKSKDEILESIYMSAISGAKSEFNHSKFHQNNGNSSNSMFREFNKSSDGKSPFLKKYLLSIFNISLIFQDLSDMSDLIIETDEFNISTKYEDLEFLQSYVSIFDIIFNFFDKQIDLNKKASKLLGKSSFSKTFSNKAKFNASDNLSNSISENNEFSNQNNANPDTTYNDSILKWISKFHLHDFNIYFDADAPHVKLEGPEENNDLENSDNLVLNIHDISITKKNMYLLYGGIKKVSIFNKGKGQNKNLLMYFLENSGNQDDLLDSEDIKIEYLIQGDRSHISIILPKILIFNIEIKIVQYFVSLVPYINKISTKLDIIKSQIETIKQLDHDKYIRAGFTRNSKNVTDISSSIIFQSQYLDKSSIMHDGRRIRRKTQLSGNSNDLDTNLEKSNFKNKVILFFQSNDMNINLNIPDTSSNQLNEGTLLSLKISPIKVDYSGKIEKKDRKNEHFSISKVQLVYDNKTILMLKGLQLHDNMQEVISYDSTNKKLKYFTDFSIIVERLSSFIDFDDLQKLVLSLNENFLLKIEKPNDQLSGNSLNSVDKSTRFNFVNFEHPDRIKFHVNIIKIVVELIDTKNTRTDSEGQNIQFGSIVAIGSDFSINLFKDTSVQFLVHHILALRIKNPLLTYNYDDDHDFGSDFGSKDILGTGNWCLNYAKKNYSFDGIKTSKVEPIISISNPHNISENCLPMIFVKTFSNQVDPKIHIKSGKPKNTAFAKGFMRNLKFEYYTEWLEMFSRMKGNLTLDDSKLANLSTKGDNQIKKTSEFSVKIRLVDCVIGLNPLRLNSKSLIIIDKGDADLYFFVNNDNENLIQLQLRKLELLLIDDQKFISDYSKVINKQNNDKQSMTRNEIYARKVNFSNCFFEQSQVSWHLSTGFKTVGNLDYLNLSIVQYSNEKLLRMPGNLKASQDIKINIGTLQIELCADSNQALLLLLSDLKVPIIISDSDKYNLSVNDESFNVFKDVEENMFGSKIASNETEAFSDLLSNNEVSDDEQAKELDKDNSIANKNLIDKESLLHVVDDFFKLSNVSKSGDLSIDDMSDSNEIPVNQLNKHLSSESSLKSSIGTSKSHLLFANNYFNPSNSILQSESTLLPEIIPIKLNLIINKGRIYLYDGYDWKSTRKAIRNKVRSVENMGMKEYVRKNSTNEDGETNNTDVQKDSNRRDSLGDFGFRPFDSKNKKKSFEDDDDDMDNDYNDLIAEGIIDEALFGSIHISLPAGANPGMLSRNINLEIGNAEIDKDEADHFSESNVKDQNFKSISGENVHFKALKLKRSKYHKIKVDISEMEVNLTVSSDENYLKQDFINGGVYSSILGENDSQLISALTAKVDDFIIHDNLPTSSWNRFASYMREAGSRETGVSILNLSLDIYKPIKILPATEAVVLVNVLPLRLYVDQDALEFLKRFAGFKDKRFLFDPIYDEILYIQKFQVNTIPIKLDYKPKKLNLIGIRSGDTSELMNIFILEGAKILLKKVKVFGIPGFDKLNDVLNSLWIPDITQTQITGIMHGLAPSLMKIGEGIKDLIVVPIDEYKKEGRIVSGLQKGAYAFVKTTGNEILKFGIKMSAGTQAILENTEGMLGGVGTSSRLPDGSFNLPSNVRDNLDIERIDNVGDKRLYQQFKAKTRKKGQSMHTSLYINNDSLDVNFDNTERGGRYYAEVFSDSDDYIDFDEDGNNISEEDAFDLDDDDPEVADADDYEKQKVFSLYADQPQNMREGMNKAYNSLGKNFNIAKNTVINASEKVSESKGAKGAFAIMAKAAPVAIMRPLIGTTEAISKTLIGLTNQIDPKERLKANDKYKPMR